ncbi:MAG: DUF481 domain-containing protein [Parasphingorhabdus sp.]|uniref:DUF481 domain-containing protein n=1 Tax=Parasphingorhabdus sp. TaxID=2709688 RepID=UPI0030016764
MLSRLYLAGSVIACISAMPAQAALPDAVTAMLDAAITSGNDADIQSVVKLAKVTNPDDISEIDAMLEAYNQQQAELAAAKAQAKADALKAAADVAAKDEDDGFFDKWSGEGQIGGLLSTGNTRNTGISGGLKLKKEAEKWRATFRALADYQRTNGATSKEQFNVTLEPNYKFNERLYVYGLAQYERDRFQGFAGRYTISGGLGYTVVNKDGITLNIKAGPAYRMTEFIGGGSDKRLAALFGLDFDWQIAKNLKLTQDAGAKLGSSTSAVAVISPGSNSFNATTALNAKLLGSLSARFSYSVEHETDPPASRLKTDTVSRMSLVYGF